ncbi:adventurous gliding motility protein AgmC, partial [Hyalangium minutum]|uniref:adventurous gliding motility protein AgmC n=1 Tax=Hyalangium minutum TaxID=394096 RepID=UPI0005C5DFF5
MKNASSRNFIRTALLAVVLCALPALAGEDIYGVGLGTDGAFSVGAGNVVINRHAILRTSVSAGAMFIDVTPITAPPAPAWSIAQNDLVMILQSTGIQPEPISGTAGPTDISTNVVGRWELAKVGTIAGNRLNLTQPLLNGYTANHTQIVRVPQYTNVTASGTGVIVARPWDGQTGGVIAFLATGTVTVNTSIDATSLGFRGGQFTQDTSSATSCSGLDQLPNAGAQKGEGVVYSRYASSWATGYGRLANGGGGGICTRSGGGGGGNAGAGGNGGNSQEGNPVGGQGGTAMIYSSLTRLIPGGGGGPGHIKGSTTAAGGQGGGIIFIRANRLAGSGTILADGFFSEDVTTGDGAGGGGAGGNIHMRFTGTADCNPSRVHAWGGKGGSTTATNAGPGGGGGGGRILFQACNGGNCVLNNSSVNGGTGGLTGFGLANGATAGAPGALTVLPDCYSPLAAPVVVAPANGSSTNNSRPVYSGTLALPIPTGTEIIIYVDNVEVGRVAPDSAGNWSFTQPTNLTTGSHSVYAVAVNTSQNLQSIPSNTNTFTVDLTPPAAPVVTAPANGATTNSTPTYTGTAEPNSTVTVIVDGNPVGTVVANGSGAWSLPQPTALTDAMHTVRATATDAAGNTGPSSATHTFTVDTTPPAAPVVVTPVNGSRTNNNRPTYTGTAEPGISVTVIVDGNPVGIVTADASGNWSFTQPTALTDASHTVRATATDTAGNTSPSSATHTFTVDTTPPAAPVVTAPANGSRTNNNRPTYTGTAEPNSTVTVIVDGTSVGTVVADGSGNWSLLQPTALTDASHTVRATAMDAAGNTSVSSATHTFIVDTTPPAAPVVTAPANGSRTNNNRPTYTGTAEPNSTVTVIVDGNPVGTAVADGSGNWSLPQPTA